jgi:hypothetical protein
MSDHREQSKERRAALLGLLFVSIVVGWFVISLPQMLPQGELFESPALIENEIDFRGEQRKTTAARGFRNTKKTLETVSWETQEKVRLLGLNSSLAEKSLRQNVDEREQIRAGLEKLRGQRNEACGFDCSADDTGLLRRLAQTSRDVENARTDLENVAATWTTVDKNIEYVME